MTSPVEVLVAVNIAVSAGVLAFVVKLAYHAGRLVQRVEHLERKVSALVVGRVGG